MKHKGTFEVEISKEPPFDSEGGVSLMRMTAEKRFTGPLAAHSRVHMLAVFPEVPGSAAYVAVERIVGSVAGKQGSFVVVHTAVRQGEQSSLTLDIAPDSGTGELRGIRGSMQIDVVEGAHHYTLDCELP